MNEFVNVTSHVKHLEDYETEILMKTHPANQWYQD